MQGRPESPCLWEKHTDTILHNIGLTPTIHEPCQNSGIIAGKQVVFKHQVNDFTIVALDEDTTNILLDYLDNQLSIPLKQQGLLDMFNGIDVTQTHDYIKIESHSYIDKFCKKYLNTWLNIVPMTENQPTPFPADSTWVKKFNAAVGPTDPPEQHRLAKKMEIKYKAGVGKLIWAI